MEGGKGKRGGFLDEISGKCFLNNNNYKNITALRCFRDMNFPLFPEGN